MKDKHKLVEGMKVTVPWGFDEIEGTVLEVWGEPPRHVRVEIALGGPEATEDTVAILLPADLVKVSQPV